MKELIKALTELLKVKSLITLSIIGALVFLAVSGTIEVAVFTSIASSIITYYFTRKSNDDIVDDKDAKIEELQSQINGLKNMSKTNSK